MTSPQARGERDRDRGRDVGAAEVVDVVVLGDHEALPLALRERVDGAVQLEQDRPAVERQLGRVRVGHVDRPRLLARRPVPELSTVRAGSDVRDHVHLLPRLLEGALDGEVVAARDDELVGRTVLPQERRQAGEEAVHRLRLDRRLEPAVQLVVERPGAVHGRDVLRDPRQVERELARVPERGRQLPTPGRPRRRARAPARRGPRRSP